MCSDILDGFFGSRWRMAWLNVGGGRVSREHVLYNGGEYGLGDIFLKFVCLEGDAVRPRGGVRAMLP